LIISRDPPWAAKGDVARLTLVAHYDSKIDPPGFIGATDSAAPCAMLLHTARSIDAALTQKWEAMTAAGQLPEIGTDKGVQILLLDGEEAFVNWSDSDSLYGARALAEDMAKDFNLPMSTYRTSISSISLFVLLDLLGEADPTVPSYWKTTHWAYRKMAEAEERLRKLPGVLKSKPRRPFLHQKDKQDDSWMGMYMQDDHVPFMKRGVEVLHLIPSPFPKVWHTPLDDGAHLDPDTVTDWATIVTAFTAEWMELEGYLPGGSMPAGTETSTVPAAATSKVQKNGAGRRRSEL
jgi:Zn-dependent M28 family amino/carboxypeptidase